MLETFINTSLLNYQSRLLDDSSNTTVDITTCIVLNISSNVLSRKMVHFVIIASISKFFQVQNKSMGFFQKNSNEMTDNNEINSRKI